MTPLPNATVVAGAAGVVLENWQETADAHAASVDELTAAHRQRSSGRVAHPVEDFLFSYYRLKPGTLRRWMPGHGVVLADAPQRSEWRHWRTVSGPAGRVDATVDVPAFLADRGQILAFVRRLVSNSAAAPAQFGCFGLHEWAMVHRQSDHRHQDWPLRLGQAGTDQVVKDHQIRCSHFDAFRFFTPAARPLNLLQPTLEGRADNEQPGCLHAGMDLYKWASKLLPAVPSDLVLDCFILAKQIRELDMRASPYDLSELGYEPVAIETVEGKAEYVAAQRAFRDRSQDLRARLLAALPSS